MKLRPLLIAFSWALCAAPAFGQSLSPDRLMSQGEIALLPPFCQDVQSVNGWAQGGRESPRSPMWIAKMGRSFWDMHHYCWARAYANRANNAAATKPQRDYLLKTAIDDMMYVVRRAPAEGMVMLPEIFYLIGQYQIQLGQIGEAAASFKRSRETKADYWPAYAGHADVLLQLGKRNDAKQLLEQGLAIMPNEPALKSRYDRIVSGGSASTPLKNAVLPKAAVRSDAAANKASIAADPAAVAAAVAAAAKPAAPANSVSPAATPTAAPGAEAAAAPASSPK